MYENEIYLNVEMKKENFINRLLLLQTIEFSVFKWLMAKACCVGGRHQRETVKQKFYDNANPKTNKIVKVIR